MPGQGLVLEPPLLSCEAVLMEAPYQLGDATELLQMLADGDLVCDYDLAGHAPEILKWIKKYAGMDPGLADACVVRLAESTPRAEVFTTDRRDFSVYRTLSGSALRCVFPPAA